MEENREEFYNLFESSIKKLQTEKAKILNDFAEAYLASQDLETEEDIRDFIKNMEMIEEPIHSGLTMSYKYTFRPK